MLYLKYFSTDWQTTISNLDLQNLIYSRSGRAVTRASYPLNALRAFEASARHLSHVKAAAELFVTPAAVSHQVKRLEEHLGLQLFRRQPRGLLLTESGQLLASGLRDVFQRLDQVIDDVTRRDEKTPLSVSVPPMFAVKWLVPRLQQFGERHPDIDVRLSSSRDLVDFRRDGFDAAVRLGGGNYPGLDATKLLDESVTPMCSPKLLPDGRSMAHPDELRRFVLLHDDSLLTLREEPSWETWLRVAGASGVDPSRGPHFSQPDHALQAAIDGAGFVLGWRSLAADDVAAGRLIAPFGQVLPLGSAFYLVYPQAHAARPRVRAFREWLLLETGAPARVTNSVPPLAPDR